MNYSTTSSIACNMNAFSTSQRKRYNILRAQIQEETTGTAEVSNGYQLAFLYKPELFILLSEFIMLERLCCPFLNFATTINAIGELTLTLTGPKGVKAFLQTEFKMQDNCDC